MKHNTIYRFSYKRYFYIIFFINKQIIPSSLRHIDVSRETSIYCSFTSITYYFYKKTASVSRETLAPLNTMLYNYSYGGKYMGKTISIFNQKGGVGKTTTCVNFAACLGHKGKKTLLVDCDPQGNSTSGVGIDKSTLEASSYDILINDVAAKDVIIKTNFKNLSVLPANMDLAGAELELADNENRFKALKKALASVVMDYDYIIIDCPPSLGLLSLNALTASDTLIVTLQCEYYALEGLSQLLGTVRTVKQHYNEHLELEGVLFTMFDTRLKLNQQVIDEVDNYFPNRAYKTKIPRSVKLAEAPSFGEPIIYYEKYSKPSFAYKKFTDEFLKKQ